MKIHTKAVHAGDRKKPAPHIPTTTPIYTASTYFYETMEQLDTCLRAKRPRATLFALWQPARTTRWRNWSTSLEGGAGALACASGMSRDPDGGHWPRLPTGANRSSPRTRSTAPRSDC